MIKRKKANLTVDTELSPAFKAESSFDENKLNKSQRKADKRYVFFLGCLSTITILAMSMTHVIDTETTMFPSSNTTDSESSIQTDISHLFAIVSIPSVVDEKEASMDIQKLEDSIVLKGNETSPMTQCSPTYQLKFYSTKQSENLLADKESQDEWFIQSLDQYGNEKAIGGDEFYITYTDMETVNQREEDKIEPAAVAFVHDLGNGKYKLDFVSTPMNPYMFVSSKINQRRGRIEVNFEYTCHMGSLPQPTKQYWKSSGMTYRKAAYSDHIQHPPIRIFEPPTSVNLSNYSHSIFFGDSTMRQFVLRNETLNKNGQKEYFKAKVEWAGNVRSELTTAKLKLNFLRKLHFFHGKQLNTLDNVALILGSSIWDLLVPDSIQGSNFEDHVIACKDYITIVRQRFPKVDIYWKGTSALHPHRVDCTESNYGHQDCVNSTKYLSNSRVVNLEQKQKILMEELNVPYLDVYPAYYLSAFYTAPGDGRHSVPELNEQILSWFFP